MGLTARTRLHLTLTAVPLAALSYLRVLRPWQLTWGATPEEVARALPGDDLVERPTLCATRAVTIAAPAERIFPWLVQVGVKRAGWYSYDWLDNLGRPSARRIHPELQQVEPGQLLPMSPDGKQGIRIYSLDPPTSMVWGTPGDTTWVWKLETGADGTTRVITRVRSRYRWTSPTILFSALLEFADIWMTRKMLLSLRERIQAIEPGTTSPEELSGRTECLPPVLVGASRLHTAFVIAYSTRASASRGPTWSIAP